jgi:hypothetical protein
LIFQRTTGFGYFKNQNKKDEPVLGISPKKKPESKNWPVLGISKNQNKEPARSHVFQNTQRNSGFHERTDDSFLVLS